MTRVSGWAQAVAAAVAAQPVRRVRLRRAVVVARGEEAVVAVRAPGVDRMAAERGSPRQRSSRCWLSFLRSRNGEK